MTDISRLPGPQSDLWEWQLQGACRGKDTELFFHPEGERGPRRANREAAAKAVCGTCPVLLACREHALTVVIALAETGSTSLATGQPFRR